MKICVLCRAGRLSQEEPYAFHLGRQRLPVVAVVDRWLEADVRYYTVSVTGGRQFVLRHRPTAGCWELAAVYGPGDKSGPAAAHGNR